MVNDLTATTKVMFSGNKEGGTKMIELETPATADHADTIAITLADYGAKGVKWVRAYRHTTTDSVVVDDDQPTCIVASGVLTITIGGSTDDKKRYFQVGVA